MKRRFLIPEIIQSSAMDCGPAALAALLHGFGISADYGRLREACQTDVDGTSIEALEDLAGRLGLDVAQIMLPPEHLFLSNIDPFPAILVTKDPVGAPHFIVAWRRVGTRVQILDPGRGRLWLSESSLRKLLFLHRMPVPAAVWRLWIESEEPQTALRATFAALDARDEGVRLLEKATNDPTWRSYAVLDAALRMVRALVAEKAISKGAPAGALLTQLFDEVCRETELIWALEQGASLIPQSYWSAAPAPATPDGEEQVMLTGAVLVRVFGVSAAAPHGPELESILREPPAKPLRHLGSMLLQDGVLAPALLLLALVAAALGGALEALLLRGVLDVGQHLGIVEQRLGGLGVLITLFAILLVFDIAFALGTTRMGRHFEGRLRNAFLTKVPRLSDHYFVSRPLSDLAHRCHTIHPVRELPQIGARLLRSLMDLLVTATGLVWIEPDVWPLVLAGVIVSTGAPLLAHRSTAERDLRVRAFDGALSRFYLDAMCGLLPIRAHGADVAIRRQYAWVTAEWARASIDRARAALTLDLIQHVVGAGVALLLVFTYVARSPEPAAILLFLFWTLNLPVLGQDIARTALLYPTVRNRLLRVSEPLTAPDDNEVSGCALKQDKNTLRAPEDYIYFRDVTVRVAGHTILHGLNLRIAKGTHVAVVGASGAGKSSLLGLLLGWHRPATGNLLVGGLPLYGDHRQRIREETAWVDPAVYLWNRSLLANLEYGAPPNWNQRMATVLEEADLLGLLERLPDGLQTELGEGGGLVAGGEGQRVRLGRAMMRTPKLVILDEALRGLDRERRHALLACARERWKESTLLCVTHDISETRDFDRVLVLESGRIREDGSPTELAAREGSVYAAMLRAEEDLRRTLWSSNEWRRVVVRDGRATEVSDGDRVSV